MTAAQPIPLHHLPTAEVVDDDGRSHTLAFTRPDSLVMLTEVLPRLGALVEGDYIDQALAAIAFGGPDSEVGEPDEEQTRAHLGALFDRLSYRVCTCGDSELVVLLLAHVTRDDRRLDKAGLKEPSAAEILRIVRLVLERDLAPFFTPRVAQTRVFGRKLLGLAKGWLQTRTGRASDLIGALARSSGTPSGSPVDGSPTGS